jgi:hypothetical protein
MNPVRGNPAPAAFMETGLRRNGGGSDSTVWDSLTTPR